MNHHPIDNKRTLSRRDFLAASAIATFTIVPRHVLGGTGYTPPSEKVNVAFIGAGGQAVTSINQLRPEPVNFVAFCDVDDVRAAGTYRRLKSSSKLTS